MSDTTAPDRLTFVAYQRPALPNGDYSITAAQRVSLEPEPFTANRTFTVAGERFTLPPERIRAVFPPDGSLGDHTSVLPHVLLERSSLPWERTPGALVRLVTLASWRFACVTEDQTFAHLARALADQGRPFRLPDSGDPSADAFLREGQVPVRHDLRQGGRTVSWYRGPFVTGPTPARTPAATAATRTPDQLLRYYTDAGMFDTGYAAAWQLGRLIALQHSAAATALYGWKRRRAQQIKRVDPSGLPLIVPHIDTDVPPSVQALFDDLARLRGVPLRYLVPDERLVPVETVRFVRLDRVWIEYLVDGAYSIGRITRLDAEEDLHDPPSIHLPEVVSGALIRSDLVAGYPGLVVDAFADADGRTPLIPVRTERLSETVLLCLFDGALSRLDLHQRPEDLHFAVEPVAGGITKVLRTGTPLPTLPLNPRGTVPVAALAGQMATALRTPVDAGAFAVQMIETADRVSFLRAEPGSP